MAPTTGACDGCGTWEQLHPPPAALALLAGVGSKYPKNNPEDLAFSLDFLTRIQIVGAAGEGWEPAEHPIPEGPESNRSAVGGA